MWKFERRGILGEIIWVDGIIKLDFRKKEKNVIRNKVRMVVWSGWLGSNKEIIRKSRMGVMVSLRVVVVFKNRLYSRNVNWKEYKFFYSGWKLNKRW